MKKMWTKFTGGLDKKTIFIIFILAMADLFVFSGVLYLRYVIPNFHEMLGLDQKEFDTILSVYGMVSLITRIPGGWLADKFSSKSMLVFSLVTTGFIGLWWTLVIQTEEIISKTAKISQLYLIYILWGISIAGLFWAPLWKLVSQNVPKEKQGAAYGLQGSFVGLLGVVLITLGAFGVTKLLSIDPERFWWAFFVFAYLIVAFIFISAILSYLFIPDKGKGIRSKIDFKKEIKNLFTPMKFLRVWLVGFFVFGMYMFQSIFAYYMKDVLDRVGVVGILVVILGSFRSYGLRFLVANPIGRISDKWKSYVFGLAIILSIGLISTILFINLPGYGDWFTNLSMGAQVFIQIILVLLFVFIGVIGWALVTLRFVQIGEIPSNKNSYASTVAVVSWLAFTPDAWFGYVASAIGEKFEEINPISGKKQYSLMGLQIILWIAVGCVVFGLICGYLTFLINRREIRKKGLTDYRWRKLGNV